LNVNKNKFGMKAKVCIFMDEIKGENPFIQLGSYHEQIFNQCLIKTTLMSRLFTLILTIFCFTVFAQPSVDQRNAGFGSEGESSYAPTPYLKDCKSSATDEERYRCTVNELLKTLQKRFECPWRDLEGEYSLVIMRFIVNAEGGLERFLTLYSDNSANRPTETMNNALIKAVYSTNGQWVPLREGGKTMPREFVLPLKCNCSNAAAPEFVLVDTVPAYYADGHYQLESFIEKNIVYPDGFLSKSGRQTTVILNATIGKDGKLDTTSIRVLNLNQIDYRLSENAINIMMQLGKRSWKPATAGGEPIDYILYFKVTYIDDKNPRRGSIPMEWDITVGNNHFFNDGAAAFNEQNYIGAIELFKRAVFLDPDDKESWLMLGQAYLGARENALARTALQRAINLGNEEAKRWMIEAEKPVEVEPKMPAKEVKKRPDRTEKVKAANYGRK
jgi:tetratricopeptide (TPR) repeat protein